MASASQQRRRLYACVLTIGLDDLIWSDNYEYRESKEKPDTDYTGQDRLGSGCDRGLHGRAPFDIERLDYKANWP